MGSGGSKYSGSSSSSPAAAAPAPFASPASSSMAQWKTRSRRRISAVSSTFSCFGGFSNLLSVDSRPSIQKVEGDDRSIGTVSANEEQIKPDIHDHEVGDVAQLSHRKLPSVSSSNDDQKEEDHGDISRSNLAASSSSSTSASHGPSSNSSGRFRPRFGLFSDGISFRLNRAVSLGSSRTNSFSVDLAVSNSETRDNIGLNFDTSLSNRNGHPDNRDTRNYISNNVNQIDARTDDVVDPYPDRVSIEPYSTTARAYRRLGSQELLEGSVRFSRTLSVGRLRDRVLRRTSDELNGHVLLDDCSIRRTEPNSARRALSRRATSSFGRSGEMMPDSSSSLSSRFPTSLIINDDPSPVRSQHVSTGHHDSMEHRSAFVERRRRIRSQVRALQRLGSRFESLSGHDRSCILSGNYRTGHCTCRTTDRAANPDDETSTRASISRIVMLAEALFEVLDEIHQQSVVLSSRPSFSSIGSVPAPNEVVEGIPVKVFSKLSKNHEEVAQCYICLVEYEEGDCMRVLPCRHEFHQACIDKWLKEIHRVCPLCRGDVCISDASSKQKTS